MYNPTDKVCRRHNKVHGRLHNVDSGLQQQFLHELYFKTADSRNLTTKGPGDMPGN